MMALAIAGAHREREATLREREQELSELAKELRAAAARLHSATVPPDGAVTGVRPAERHSINGGSVAKRT